VKIAAVTLLAIAIAIVAVAVADQPAWQLDAPARVSLEPGVPGAIDVQVIANRGRTISRDGPLRIDVVAPAGLEVKPRRRLTLTDAADPAAASPKFAIRINAEKAGTYPVEVAVRFWLCAKKTCKPVRKSTTIDVVVGATNVDAAPAPPDAPSLPPDAGSKRRPRK
jgi:hypothetical protein